MGLSESKLNYRAVVDADYIDWLSGHQQPMAVVKENEKYLAVNAAFAEFLGFDGPEEAISVLNRQESDKQLDRIGRTLCTPSMLKNGTSIAWVFQRKDQSHVVVDLFLLAVRFRDGMAIQIRVLKDKPRRKSIHSFPATHRRSNEIVKSGQTSISRLFKESSSTEPIVKMEVSTKDLSSEIGEYFQRIINVAERLNDDSERREIIGLAEEGFSKYIGHITQLQGELFVLKSQKNEYKALQEAVAEKMRVVLKLCTMIADNVGEVDTLIRE